jgi:hypothetical protein
MKTLHLATLLAIGSLVACAPTVTGRQYVASTLAPKAAFDLSCPAAQLQFANLGNPVTDAQEMDGKVVWVNGMSVQQGVSGCGRRGRYVLVQGEWIMNAGTDQNR